MRKFHLASLLLAAAVTVASVWSRDVASSSTPVGAAAPIRADGGSPRAPATTRFVPNVGQWSPEARFAVLGDSAGWLHDDGFTLRLERWSRSSPGVAGIGEEVGVSRCIGAVVRTRFENATTEAAVAGASQSVRQHFFVGERSRWRSDVPACADVTLRSVRPGIDVRFRPVTKLANTAADAGSFEYDLLLAPGADLGGFTARCEGIEVLRLDPAGRLCATVSTPLGAVELVQQAPIAWQVTPDGPRPLVVRFRLLGTTRYGFVADDLDPRLPAVVDPGVVWGTYLGGGLTEAVRALQWQPGAGVWVGGWAGSTDFPATPGAFDTVGGADAFVAHLAEDGNSLVSATYLGGNGGDEVRGLALGPQGTPTVVGFTHSTDFPTTPGALRSVYAGSSPFLDVGDAFVVRFNAAGSALLAATYLGGLYDEVAEAVVVDALGNAAIAGWTSSADFPVSLNAARPALGGIPAVQSDGFVCRVSADATTLLAGTFVGGQLADQFWALDRDPGSGDLWAGGFTIGSDFPLTGSALQPALSGSHEGVVVRVNAACTSILYSSYFGGVDEDAVAVLRRAADGTIWLGGLSRSPNFPTTPGAPQQALGGLSDGFVTRLSANGQSLLYSTLLGGPGLDQVRDLSLASVGVLAVGEAGVGFPTTPNATQSQLAGGVLDAFAVFLDTAGARAWSSYFGGGGSDAFGSAWLDNSGLAVVGGWSFSEDFPVDPAGYQDERLGAEDGVVLKLDLLSTLGQGFAAASLAPPAVVPVAAGSAELLAGELHNQTVRDLVVDSVRVLVTGVGVTGGSVGALRFTYEPPGESAIDVGGPVPILPGEETEVALQGLVVPAGTTGVLRAFAVMADGLGGASVEATAALIAPDSWQVRAIGAGAGPEVRVLTPARVGGTVVLLGALPGDVDGDGRVSVVDVRRQAVRLGAAAGPADCDGDGVYSTVDLEATRAALLGRGTVLAVQQPIAPSGWLVLRGVLPQWRSVSATLGGRALTLGAASPRQVTFAVGVDQPTGLQELVVTAGGSPLFTGLVAVQ